MWYTPILKIVMFYSSLITHSSYLSSSTCCADVTLMLPTPFSFHLSPFTLHPKPCPKNSHSCPKNILRIHYNYLIISAVLNFVSYYVGTLFEKPIFSVYISRSPLLLRVTRFYLSKPFSVGRSLRVVISQCV